METTPRSDRHISRGWIADPFEPDCGCTLLECGHVDADQAVTRRCEQHDPQFSRTIRSQHEGARCDQDFARTAFPEAEPDYVYATDVLGEDDGAYIFALREGTENYWERFDRRKPNHMRAYEQTKSTGRVSFLELEGSDV
jgi:hypothetical protein